MECAIEMGIEERDEAGEREELLEVLEEHVELLGGEGGGEQQAELKLLEGCLHT